MKEVPEGQHILVSMRQGEEQRLQCKFRKGLAMDELI